MNTRNFFVGRAVVFVIILIIIGFFAFNSYIQHKEQGTLPQNFKDITFTISGEQVTMHDGVAMVQTSLGGASTTTVRYFGNELVTDVDGDGKDDTVFLITQDAGGSGTFFYAVAALARDGGYIGSQAVLIGDRIAPQTTEKGEGRIVIVNYAERKATEPMTATPSVGKSLYLLLDTKTLEFGEVVQNFEGESASGTMK